MNKIFTSIIGFLSLFLLGCRENNTSLHSPSFYYWKLKPTDTTLQLSVKNYQIEHVYIKWFDIDWLSNKNQPGPIAVLSASTLMQPLFNIPNTPVVFINNSVFTKIDTTAIESLANHLIKALEDKALQLEQNGIGKDIWSKIKEIQIDCDWTPSTQKKYFLFLSFFKNKIVSKQLSVTLRLYPYKYPDKMGVPPVDKAILMCYNMDQIKNFHTTNSIFDIKILQQYINKKTYPLPLELALPTFGWYAWFRNEQFKGIVYEAEFKQIQKFATITDDNVFKLTDDVASTFNYFKTGDQLRREWPSNMELIEGFQLIQANIPNIQKIHYFYLDDHTFPSYEKTVQTIHSL